MPPQEIGAFVEGFEKEAKQIKADAIRMSWYMRGGINYEQILMASPTEREAINDLIKENLETTKKSGLNFF